MEIDLFTALGIDVPDSKPVPPTSVQSAKTTAPSAGAIPAKQAQPAQLPVQSMKSFLLARYPLRIGSRFKDTYQPLKIDDRWAGDVFQPFCEISLTVPAPEDGTFLLELTYPPEDDQVHDLIREHKGRRTDEDGTIYVRFALTLKSVSFLRKLAKTIGQVTSIRRIRQTGQGYDEPNWKWLAERTEKLLHKLADVLWEYRKETAAANQQRQASRPRRRRAAKCSPHPEKLRASW